MNVEQAVAEIALAKKENRSAKLSNAELSGADLSGANGTFQINGDCYVWLIIERSDGVRIRAGCHWFGMAEARKYWSGSDAHSILCSAALDAVKNLCVARGWIIEKEAD